MKVVYHGTRYLHQILTEQRLKISEIGEKHISFTTKKHVAHYWALMDRDDVFGFGHIVTFDWVALAINGFSLQPFVSDMAYIREYEVISKRNIEDVWQYIVKIEKVPGSYVGPAELGALKAKRP